MSNKQGSLFRSGGRRVLALDVGERRIGVAMSDDRGLLATPLTTVKAEPQARALAQIAALVQEHQVDELVLGLPLTLRGEIGPQAQVVQSFAAELEKVLRRAGKGTVPPLRFFDERLTSSAAEQMLRDLGIKPEKRKERLHEVAASIILQDYLDHTRNRTMND
ncbi:MAG: Holliday junction resolvase RuvX [Chloroflexales bacterium]|nr:Holliday junction resolvase RuvX [Chloroflexales bacterium]